MAQNELKKGSNTIYIYKVRGLYEFSIFQYICDSFHFPNAIIENNGIRVRIIEELGRIEV